METDEGGGTLRRPTAAEAAAALREVGEARATLAGTRPPWWFLPGTAVLIATAPLAQVVPDPPLGVVVLLGGLVVWMGLLGVLLGAAVRRTGVMGRVAGRPARILLGVLAGLAVVAGVLYLAFDLGWAPTALAELLAAAVLGYAVLLAVARRRRESA